MAHAGLEGCRPIRRWMAKQGEGIQWNAKKEIELKGRTKIVRLWESEEKETQIGGGWTVVTGNRSVLCIYWGSLLRSWIQVCHSWVCADHMHWTRSRYSQRKRGTHLAEVKSNKVQAPPKGCGYVKGLNYHTESRTMSSSIWIFCPLVVRKSGRWEELREANDLNLHKCQVEFELQSVWNGRKIVLILLIS